MEPFGPLYLFSPGLSPSWTSTGTASRTLSNPVASNVAGANFTPLSVLINDSPGDGFYTAGVSFRIVDMAHNASGSGSLTSAFGVNLAQQTASKHRPWTIPCRQRSEEFVFTIRDSTGVGFTRALIYSFLSTQINIRHDVARYLRVDWYRAAQAHNIHPGAKASGSLRSRQR